MVLEDQKHEGGVRKPFLTPPVRLNIYVGIVCLLGAAALVIILAGTDWKREFSAVPLWSTAFLAAAAIIGEVRPIVLPRPGGGARSLSTSAPFVLALVAVAGVTAAVAVQIIASMTDDALRRRAPKKSLFNTSQYTLAVLTAGAIYGSLTGRDIFSVPVSVEAGDVGPLLLGGLAMFVVNWVLVAGVVALVMSQTVFAVLRDDVRNFLVTNLVLLSIGGIASLIAIDGPIALALLAAPVVAAHLFAAQAARHAYEATHDTLTGLGNRSALNHELEKGLADAARAKTSGPALVLIDLDHFKDFNDTLGHPFGDQILRKVASQLVEAAPEGASAHRLGGDEFAVVLHGNEEQAEEGARKLLASLDDPMHVEGLELLVRASAGIAVAPAHGTDEETLMKNVDIALYHAKLERDRISMYSPDFDINTLERLQTLADLRTAIDQGQLCVSYQPQVDLNDGSIVGVEALVRWEHSRRGQVRADEFIALAESSGLVAPLTSFVLDTALADIARWRKQGYDFRMAVNLSARLLSDLALPSQVASALKSHKVPASSLVLEVTETGILADAVRADAVVHGLRGLGVAIAIDDYGTGNASLNYLKKLEIDELKIDKSFVGSIGTDENDLIIVRSTISLARALGLRVVAEGIEDQETTDALRELGCPIGQGYHLGRPVSAKEIDELLSATKSAAASGL